MIASLSREKRNVSRPHLWAVRHFESLQERLDPLVSSPLVSMFTQDIPLAVMPYRSSGESDYDAKIVGADLTLARCRAARVRRSTWGPRC